MSAPHTPDVKEWRTVAAGTTRIGACATCGREAHDHKDGEWTHADPEAPHFHPAEVRRAQQVRAGGERFNQVFNMGDLPRDPEFVAKALAWFLRGLAVDGYDPHWIVRQANAQIEEPF